MSKILYAMVSHYDEDLIKTLLNTKLIVAKAGRKGIYVVRHGTNKHKLNKLVRKLEAVNDTGTLS